MSQQQAPVLHPNVAQARQALLQFDPTTAARLCRERMAQEPRDANARLTLSDAQLLNGDFEGAVQTLKAAIEKFPGQAIIHFKLGQAYFREGLATEALEQADAALRLHPDLDAAVSLKASTMLRQGKDAKVRKILAPHIRAETPPPWTGPVIMRTLHRLDEYETAVEFSGRFASLYGEDQQHRAQYRGVMFERARALERLDRYDEAFEAATTANTVFPSAIDRSLEHRRLLAIEQMTTRERLANYPKAEVSGDDPPIVFIIGMPRSGSTLLERMLDAHPDVSGLDEDSSIHRVLYGMHQLAADPATTGQYPAGMSRWTPAMVAEAREDALRTMRLRSGPGRIWVNKNLGNAQHIAAISLLFPEARFLLTRRNPADTCLSCWMEPLGLPGSGNAWAADLVEAGWYHRRLDLSVERQREASDVRLMDVVYEDLVDDQEATIRKVLEFIGLEWNDSVLSFHQSKKVVRTLSFDQVNKPVYRKSVDRAARYGERLDPLRAILAADPLSDIPAPPPPPEGQQQVVQLPPVPRRRRRSGPTA